MRDRVRLGAMALLLLLTGCADFGDYDDDGDSGTGNVSTTSAVTPQFSDGRSYHPVAPCPQPGHYRSSPDYATPPQGMSAAAWTKILGELDQDEGDIYALCQSGRLYATDYAANVVKFGTVKPQ